MPLQLPISPLQLIPEHPGTAQGIALYLKRDDLLHPVIEGSKARKLAAVLPSVLADFPGGIVTFGGAFSNHLQAVAAAGALFGLSTYGILRGEYMDLHNSTLLDCQSRGMQLLPLPRTQYDAYKALDWGPLMEKFPGAYCLPEGGNTPQALRACSAITEEILTQLPECQTPGPIYLCAPAGTACTVAGMMAGLGTSRARVWVYPVSHQGIDRETIQRLLTHAAIEPKALDDKFSILEDYIFGGFARYHAPVVAFAHRFHQATNIRLDPIYTAKMMYGVYDGLQKGHFEPNSSVVVLHTGGLQGWAGFNARYGV